MYIVAHADDTLLFESPALLKDVQSEHCVRTVFLTAGDAGRAQSYWSTRETGAEAGYAKMAGVPSSWTNSVVNVAGHSINFETLNGKPNISIAYLRLPDGGTNGEGFSAYGMQSLPKLWRGGNLGSPSISSITAVDSSATYTYQGLIDTLLAMMDSFEPSQVVTQNYNGAFVGPNHPDHVASAYFARAAHKLFTDPHRLTGYLDYEISVEPQNVFGAELTAKQQAFYEYGKFDSDACPSEAACTGSSYAKWLLRQYSTGSETTSVVAHAGYMQTTTASTGVTLNGSQSSEQTGKALQYTWTQTGGPTVALSGGTTATPSFTTPSHPTVLTFSLVVKSGSTSSPPDYVKVRVPSADPTPVADAGPEQTAASGAKVDLDGSESWDPNSLSLQYAWSQTSGPAVTLTGASTATPSFTAPTGPATLKFGLTVSNGTQTSTASSVTVNVNGIAPAITSANATTFTTGVNKSFTVTTTGAPTATVSQTGTLPGGLTFTPNGNGTATISGTAEASAAPPGQSVNFPITLKAKNSVSEATQSFTLTVTNPGQAPAFTSANTTAFTTGVEKSFTITTSGAPAATIKQLSGSLPIGLEFKNNGDGTATISGTADASAAAPNSTQNYPISLTAESIVKPDANQTLTIAVTNPGAAPAITSAASTTFTTGVEKTFTVTTTGAPAATIEQISGSLPSGLTFKNNGNGTATISGTAATSAAPPNSTQNYSIGLKAKNGVSPEATQTFTLTVANPGAAPAITSAASTTFTTGVEKTFTVTTTGAPTATVSKSAGSTLPAGLSFTQNANGTATISGTALTSAAPPNSTQNYTIALTAANGVNPDATQNLVITVSNPGQAPAITSSNATTFTTGVNKSFTVTTTGAPTATVSQTGTLPGGLTFTPNGNGTATISGTAEASAAPPGQSVNFPITLKAKNGVTPEATQSFTLTVTNPGQAPAFTSSNTTAFTTGVEKSFTITTSGAPIPSLGKEGALPAGLTYTNNGNGTATISGTADPSAAAPNSTQNYTLDLTAKSIVKPDATQTLTIAVTNPGAAPAITSANATTFTTGVNKSFTITTTGSPAATITKASGSLPTGLTFKDNGNGTATISGTAANAAAPPNDTQNYSLSFEADNKVGTPAKQTFTLTVSNPGQAPAITSSNATTFTTGVEKTFTVTTTGAPTATVSKSAGSTLPTGLTFTQNANGTATISGTALTSAAPPNSTQNYTIALTAANGVNPDATQNLVITVSNPGQAPSITSAASTTFTTGVEKTFTITTTGSPAATITKGSGSLPTGLTFKDNGNGTATISGTAANAAAPPNDTQNYSLSFEADNKVGTPAKQTFTLTVSNPGAAPAITSSNATTFTTGVNKSFTVTTTGAPTATVSQAGTLPAGLEFKNNGDGTGSIFGTASTSAAPPGQSVNFPITLKAKNGVTPEATQSFTLTVTNPGQAPAFTSANTTAFTTGIEKSFTITTSGAPIPSLSKEGALPTGLTYTDNGNGTATISGTADPSAAAPNSTQNYTLDLTAKSIVKPDANQTLTIAVTNPGAAPAFTSANATTFTTGVNKSFTITTTGAPAATIKQLSGSLPTGLTFKDNGNGTATISGTAANAAAPPNDTQNYSLTFEADNKVGTPAKQTFTLTVANPGAAPAITSAASTTFTTGVEKTFTVTTTGAPTATVSKSAGSTLPAGLTFTQNANGTATISGTALTSAAPPNSTQNYTIALTAANGVNPDATQNLVITVSNPGQAPSITSAASTTFTTGVNKSFTITTTGAPSATIKQAGTLPAGLSFTQNANGTATISGTADPSAAPPAGSQGYSLTFEADNKVGSPAKQTFTLTVSNPGSSPAFTSADHATFETGVAKSFTITTSGAPAPAIERISGSLPAGLTFTDHGDGTATIAGTAESGAAPPAGSQNYAFGLEASSSVGSKTQNLTLTVENPGVAPGITSSASTAFTTGVAKSFTVTTSGAPAPVVSRTGNLPAGLTFTQNGDGTATISGTASSAAAPPAGSQPYTLTLQAGNGVGSAATQTFTLTVSNPGAAPVFSSPASAGFTTGVAQTFTISVAGAPAAALSVSSGSLPAGLGFNDNGNGTATISGTATAAAAAPGQSQAYGLAVKAANVVGSASQALTLTVTNPEPPVTPPTNDPPQNSAPTGPTGPTQSALRLSKDKVQLPAGKSVRRVVDVLPSPASAVGCLGTLPRGARCRVTELKRVVIESTRNVRVQGTYRLTVHVDEESGTVRLPLIVQVQRPGKAVRRAAHRSAARR